MIGFMIYCAVLVVGIVASSWIMEIVDNIC